MRYPRYATAPCANLDAGDDGGRGGHRAGPLPRRGGDAAPGPDALGPRDRVAPGRAPVPSLAALGDPLPGDAGVPLPALRLDRVDRAAVWLPVGLVDLLAGVPGVDPRLIRRG